MNNLGPFTQIPVKVFIVLWLFFTAFSIQGQGWELFIPPQGEEYVHLGWQSYATGDGHYFTYSTGLGPTGVHSVYLHKINIQGEVEWKLEIPGSHIAYPLVYDPIIPCGSNEFVTAYTSKSTDFERAFFIKFDDDGNSIWEHEIFPGIDQPSHLYTWTNATDGGIYFFAAIGNTSPYLDYYFGKLNCDGNLAYFNQLDSPVLQTFEKLLLIDNQLHVFGKKLHPHYTGEFSYSKVDNQGGLSETQVFQGFTDTYGPIVTPNNEFIFIKNKMEKIIQVKTDLDGMILTEDTIYQGEELAPFSLVTNVDDGLIISGNRKAIAPNGKQTGYAIKTDYSGTVIWEKFYDHRNAHNNISGVIKAANEGYVLTGYNNGEGYVLKVDENGNIYSNLIQGNISQDIDFDCNQSALDIPIANWLITAEKMGDTFVGSSDSNGNYLIPVDTGNYVINCLFPNDYWTSCQNDSMVNIPDFDNQFEIDYSIDGAVDCPLMTIDGNTPFLRPCFERPAYFQYCNQGPAIAQNVRIEITLDAMVTATSLSAPWTNQIGNTYIYEIGDIHPFECGNFSMSLFLDCDASLGDIYSVEARAFPDTLCFPPPPQYSGAFIELSGVCNEDSLIFTIRNVGSEPMDEPEPYIIVEDAVLGYADEVELDAGDFRDISLSSNGATFTMIASQVANAPGNSNPLIVLEGCGTNDQGTYSTGFGNQFDLDDGNPAYDIDFIIARNSFDPNAKSAFPEGYEEEHYIRPNTPLEYFIYFQNTGSDTAFTVVLKDTLDQWLDLRTFQTGASSHIYSYQFEENRTLKFTFNEINLPDSSTNQLGSNGFVSFKINPLKNTPLQTIINNRAAIYFDFNEPIITNETFHTLAEDFITILVHNVSQPYQSKSEITISPNPFVDQTLITISNHESSTYKFELFDVHGRLLESTSYENNSFWYQPIGLSKGVYFYRITADNLRSAGRILIN